MRLAIGGSFAGGIGSQFSKMSSPSLGAGVDDFTSGLVQSGQILLAMPSKLGRILAVSSAMSGLISGIDTYKLGLANAAAKFDVENSVHQKLISQLDGISAALNDYEQMIGDASISLEAINRQQRKYAETVAELEQTSHGSTIAAKLSSAPDNKSRMSIMMDEKGKIQPHNGT